MPRPLAVAITGGIGAGKSEALRAFARHGAETISSDEIVHELLRDDNHVRRALIKRFGPGVKNETGKIDRRRVADVVFSDREQHEEEDETPHACCVSCSTTPATQASRSSREPSLT